MSDHIPDLTKIIGDTPISDSTPHNVAELGMLCRRLERELNRACEMYRKLDIHTLDLVDRIRRLEAAGDAMERLLPDGSICDKAANLWREAKEAKL